MNSENNTENTKEIYEIKARLKSLNGNIRSVHYRNTISYQEICKRVAQKNPTLLKVEVQNAVELFLTGMVESIITEGVGVRIDKFGVFSARPKPAKKSYIPSLGEERWIPSGSKFHFKPSRNLQEYFKENGKQIYKIVKENKEALDSAIKERNKEKNSLAEAEGWNSARYYKKIEDLSEKTLQDYKRDGRITHRLKVAEELGDDSISKVIDSLNSKE